MVPLYGGWQVGTLIGVLVGAQVPAAWVAPLTAVFPLVFLVLTILLCTSVPLAIVAVVGGLLSLVGSAFLPPGGMWSWPGPLASLVGLPAERLLRSGRS